MFGNKNHKGFTLIEMLVVIAVIAVLISIIAPAISSSTDKARATTDAANLRNVLGQVNTILVGNNKLNSVTAAELQTAVSITYPSAKVYVLYCDTHFVETYYVVGDQYYSIDYFADLAANGSTTISTEKPVPAVGSNLVYEWFIAGEGAVTPDD